MRDFRIAVGNSLKDKLGELGFFLKQIVDVARAIERKHLYQEYPINAEMNQLNYYFSAYLNAIQALKDGFQTATGVALSWNDLSPTYGKFIFYCRNATTHDGYHLINAIKGGKCYIAGPLRRINRRENLIEFDPPQEDIQTLCCDISEEMLASLRRVLNRNDVDIPYDDEADSKKYFQESLDSNFIPLEVRALMKANQHSIEKSFEGVKIDVMQKIFDAIASVEMIVADVRT
ncbi:MAG TPA: hypothetical protein EYG92_07415 [Lutibacter sp.]|nr:hypothetical protein [Lutibacter sp.]